MDSASHKKLRRKRTRNYCKNLTPQAFPQALKHKLRRKRSRKCDILKSIILIDSTAQTVLGYGTIPIFKTYYARYQIRKQKSIDFL